MKDIFGYEGLYAITSCGKVWSYKSKKFLKLKQRKDNGYLEVSLCKNGVRKTRLIHRLVAEAFIPNPNNLPQVSHLDETKHHNWVNNLTWATAKENCNMPLHLKRKSKSQINNKTSKKVECVETSVIYESLSEAGRQLGCSPQNIYQACRNPEKRACGYHWRYAE